MSNVKKFALIYILLLFLSSLLISFPKINIVRASGTIYIRADGTVEGTDNIQRDGNVYTFTGNIYDSIVVERDNIVVDGAGYTVQGTGADDSPPWYRGIDLSHRSNVTIKNTRISNFHYGIHLDESLNNNIIGNYITNDSNIALYSSSNNNISGNNIKDNNGNGIYLSGPSNDNNISANYITNNNIGLFLYMGSSKNTISGNNITNNYSGIYLCEASNNIVYRNNFINNHYPVFDVSMELWYAHVSVNIWDAGYPSGGNYWGDYEARYPNAKELDGSGICDTPYVIYGNNQDNYPLMEPVIIPEFPDTTPPTISIVSPENKTYAVGNVSLTFTVSEPTSWMGYSLDGQANVTITGDITLTGLAEKPHTLTVYAKDIAGNTGASETIYFSIKTEPFPTTWVAAAIAIVALVGVALMIYFTKVIRRKVDKTK